MKFDCKSLLVARLGEIKCERLPEWVAPRLLSQIEGEASAIGVRAEQELRERVARVVSVKSVAAALAVGPLIEEKKA